MKRKSLIWAIGYFAMVGGLLTVSGGFVYKVDPFFHYHKPDTEKYYYNIDNQRSQNDGIIRHFDYDAVITGTSMTENFKTTEMDKIFGTKSIKLPFSGGTYNEINYNLEAVFKNNDNVKTVVRGLDMNKIIEDKDAMREDLGEYPKYLYDDNILNDVKYIYNRDILFTRSYNIVADHIHNPKKHGITSFDAYSYWQDWYTFGYNTVCPEGMPETIPGRALYLTEKEKKIVIDSARQNIVALAKEQPNVTFYCFITPYSMVWWQTLVNDGTVYKQIEAEKVLIEELLQCDNIKLYSFNDRPDIIADMNNYKDDTHYASWISTLILRNIKDGKGLITKTNYQKYIENELAFITTFDYESLKEEEDYANDYYCAALFNKEISGVSPINMTDKIKKEESYTVNDISKYKYIVFYGKKDTKDAKPEVKVLDYNDTVLAECKELQDEMDDKWNQYIIDVSNVTGLARITFNGGEVDSTDKDTKFEFKDIKLY